MNKNDANEYGSPLRLQIQSALEISGRPKLGLTGLFAAWIRSALIGKKKKKLKKTYVVASIII